MMATTTTTTNKEEENNNKNKSMNVRHCICFQDVKDAAKRINGIVHRTPVLTSSSIDKMMNMNIITSCTTNTTTKNNRNNNTCKKEYDNNNDDDIQSTTTTTTTPRTAAKNVNLFFKVEAMQRTGSFKFRGATNAVQKLIEQEQQQTEDNEEQGDKTEGTNNNNVGSTKTTKTITVVTHSSGNHAQALALAAKMASSSSSSSSEGQGGTTTTNNKNKKNIKVNSTIVMPRNTPIVKKDAVSAFGGNIIMVDNTNEARENEASRIVNENTSNGMITKFIHPSEDPLVIAGQGTVCLEFVEQVRDMKLNNKSRSDGDPLDSSSSFLSLPPPLDVVIIPVGGGGLASGNIIALRGMFDDNVKIVLAEPIKLDDAKRSFDSGKLIQQHRDENVPLDSVADGLKTTLGYNTWTIIRDYVNDIYTVSEEHIIQATKIIWERLKICIEPSAGVGIAVALYSTEFHNKYCCCTINNNSTTTTSSSSCNNDDDNNSNNNRMNNTKNIGIVLCGGNVDVIKISQRMKEMEL